MVKERKLYKSEFESITFPQRRTRITLTNMRRAAEDSNHHKAWQPVGTALLGWQGQVDEHYLYVCVPRSACAHVRASLDLHSLVKLFDGVLWECLRSVSAGGLLLSKQRSGHHMVNWVLCGRQQQSGKRRDALPRSRRKEEWRSRTGSFKSVVHHNDPSVEKTWWKAQEFTLSPCWFLTADASEWSTLLTSEWIVRKSTKHGGKINFLISLCLQLKY